MSKILLSNIVDINKSTFKINNTHKYIYYLDTANITQNVISNIQKLYPQKDNIPSRAKRAVSNNTIIYSSVRPNLCHFGILSNIPSNMVVSTGFITIDVKNNNIDPYYLFYLITTKEKIDYITNIANTSVSSYPSITPEILGNMEIEIIDNIYEQKRIGTLLKTIDNKIKLNNKINDELEAMAKTIYDYWFLQFEFPNEEGKPYKSSGGKMVWNEELKREIPEGWKVNNILNVCDVVDCLHSKKPTYCKEYEDYYLLTLENLTEKGYIDLSKKYYISKTDYEKWTSRILVKENDFVVTNAGRAGDIGKIPYGVKCAIGRNLTAIRPKNINPYYLRQFFKSNYLKEQVLSNLDCGSFFMSFNVKSIKSLNVLIPNEDIMKKSIDILKPIILKIENNIVENQELTSLRDFLLPLLMNGQVGFKGDKAEG